MPRYLFIFCTPVVAIFQAFKFLEDSTEDGADSLYGCIWDMAILEFAMSLHTKRGEVNNIERCPEDGYLIKNTLKRWQEDALQSTVFGNWS